MKNLLDASVAFSVTLATFATIHFIWIWATTPVDK